MAKSRSPLVLIFITIFIDLVGFGIVIPVLPLYAKNYNATETVVGLLLAVYSAMQFIFSPVLGRLSDKVGRRPVLLVSLAGTSFGFIIMGTADTLAAAGLGSALVWLFIARIIDGISGGNISTARAYIADVTPPEERSKGMGLIGAAFGLGFIFGPAIGGLMSNISPEAPFFFAAALAAANATAVYFLLPESLSAEHRATASQRVSLREVLAQSGGWQLKAVMATYFFSTVAFAMLTATFALFANARFAFNEAQTGYLFTYVGVLGAIIQGGLIGRLVKAFGEKQLVLIGTMIFAVSLFTLPLSTSLTFLLLTSTGIAIGNSLVTPTLNGLASKSVSPAWQGRILGAMSAVASLARIIGPVLGGFLLDFDRRRLAGTGTEYGQTPYWTSAAIMVIALLFAISVHSIREIRSAEVGIED
jgi:DHA1 family tetracycline resistance protein-like MFS transporter